MTKFSYLGIFVYDIKMRLFEIYEIEFKEISNIGKMIKMSDVLFFVKKG